MQKLWIILTLLFAIPIHAMNNNGNNNNNRDFSIWQGIADIATEAIKAAEKEVKEYHEKLDNAQKEVNVQTTASIAHQNALNEANARLEQSRAQLARAEARVGTTKDIFEENRLEATINRLEAEIHARENDVENHRQAYALAQTAVRQNQDMLNEVKQRADRAEEVASDLFKTGAQSVMRVGENFANEHIQGDRLREQALGQSHIQANAFYNNVPKLAKYGSLLLVTLFAAKEGSRVFFNLIEKYAGRPSLVLKTSRRTLAEKLKEAVLGIKIPEYTLKDVIIAPDTEKKIKEIALGTKQAYTRNLPLMNDLFYGEPGTGKTMTAIGIALLVSQNSPRPLDYAVISGSNFSQFKEGDDIVELNKLFEWAEASENGLLVFVDEADSFLIERDPEKARKKGITVNSTRRTINLTNAFLSRVEKQTAKKIKFVFATNNPRSLDDAVLNRIPKSNWVAFKKPDAALRKQLLEFYFNRQIKANKFTIAQEVTDSLDQLSLQLEGLVGRDIDGLVSVMLNKMNINKSNVLTLNIAQEAITETIEATKADFTRSAAAA